jgi:phosphohistidine phosphatase
MDLVLWRHADAEEGSPDLGRKLTPKGHKQADRMARWLERRLPKDARIVVSPAARAQETAQALNAAFETSEHIAPGAEPAALLKAADWPRGNGTVVLVAHQPALGMAAALALTGRPAEWRMRKGGAWWIRSSESGEPPLVVAVMTPDLT